MYLFVVFVIDCWVCNFDDDLINCGESINELGFQDVKWMVFNCVVCGKFFKSLGIGIVYWLNLNEL